jgi:hypothetical protein
MKPNTLLILQSAAITVQFINAGIATVTDNAVLALMIAAVAGGFQYYVTRAANLVEPNKPKE